MGKVKFKNLENTLKKFIYQKKENLNSYPLLDDAFTFEDLNRGIDVILSGKITMGEITRKFENEFSNFVGAKHAIMVNSGSSANLLAAFALTNPKEKSPKKTMNF